MLELADDAGRQFAPRPAEVKATILQRNPVPKSAPVNPRSLCEPAKCRQRLGSLCGIAGVTDEAVQVRIAAGAGRTAPRGVTITGRMGVMAVTFSEACEAGHSPRRYVRVAVYPEVRIGCRCRCALRCRIARRGLPRRLTVPGIAVQGAELAEVVKAVNTLRGQQQRPVTLGMIPCAIS